MFKHILVPVDGSELSNSAVKRAVSFASDAKAKICFYHAQPAFVPPLLAGEGVIMDAGAQQMFADARIKEAEHLLKVAAEHAQKNGVSCHTVTDIHDAPWQGIIEVARQHQCDLIFMSSHGRRGVASLLLGSETQKVLTHCSIPVLVFRDPAK